jgi:hypothetical protein
MDGGVFDPRRSRSTIAMNAPQQTKNDALKVA